MKEPLASWLTSNVDRPYRAAVGHSCAGSEFHSPTPLVLHEVVLSTGEVLLCSVCEENLNLYLRLRSEFAGAVPWKIERQFGNSIRALARTVSNGPGQPEAE